MDIRERTVLKQWGNCKTSLLVDTNGNRFIEKTDSNNLYDSNEYEIYASILNPLRIGFIPTVRLPDPTDRDTFRLDYIDGVNCQESPTAEDLYKAATLAGTLYHAFTTHAGSIDARIIRKYHLTQAKLRGHMERAARRYDMRSVEPIIGRIYADSQTRPLFLNHFDLHFKNMMRVGDSIYFVDWAEAQISHLYIDLFTILSQAKGVSADRDAILSAYQTAAKLDEIPMLDILAGGFVLYLVNVHWLDEMRENVQGFGKWADLLYEYLLSVVADINNIR